MDQLTQIELFKSEFDIKEETLHFKFKLANRCKFMRDQFNLKTEGHFIYFIVDNNDLLYIGQTTALRQRITLHRQDKSFKDVYFINLADYSINYILYLEAAAIYSMKPGRNKIGNISPLPVLKKYQKKVYAA